MHTLEIEKALNEYFIINDQTDISPEMLWAAHKVTIRGTLIQIATRIKKERQLDVLKLENTFSDLKAKHKKPL